MDLLLEASAVVLNLIYLFLLIKERISCWFFGIAASLLSIILFYKIGLYSEAILYVYYVIIGFYGYWLWSKNLNSEAKLKVSTRSAKFHVIIISIGILISLTVGYGFSNYTDAVNPYLDAATTTFSFIASILEAKKILSSWLFWIVINAATIVLYIQQDLVLYLLLTFVYFGFSITGFLQWKKSYQLSKRLESCVSSTVN